MLIELNLRSSLCSQTGRKREKAPNRNSTRRKVPISSRRDKGCKQEFHLRGFLYHRGLAGHKEETAGSSKLSRESENQGFIVKWKLQEELRTGGGGGRNEWRERSVQSGASPSGLRDSNHREEESLSHDGPRQEDEGVTFIVIVD